MSIESYGGESVSDGGPIQAHDIKPDDCTLALLACIANYPNDTELLSKLRRRDTVREDGTPAIGCIACLAKISLPEVGEPKYTGFCRAPFAAEARGIVAPKYQKLLDSIDKLTDGIKPRK